MQFPRETVSQISKQFQDLSRHIYPRPKLTITLFSRVGYGMVWPTNSYSKTKLSIPTLIRVLLSRHSVLCLRGRIPVKINAAEYLHRRIPSMVDVVAQGFARNMPPHRFCFNYQTTDIKSQVYDHGKPSTDATDISSTIDPSSLSVINASVPASKRANQHRCFYQCYTLP